ncbi:MAG TPA: hypothetical protein VI357_27150 [Mycobacteriales bacterium]
MPDPADLVRGLLVGADLRVEMDDGRHRTTARLRDESGQLVLDVDDPAVLARALPARGPARALPAGPARELSRLPRVRLRSRGRDLGSVRVTRSGRFRVRPTPAGLALVPRLVPSGRLLAYLGTAAVLTAVLVRRLRRS